jgi:hypothetical protein
MADKPATFNFIRRRQMHILIVGTICGPKTFHGPFEDVEHANQWAASNVGQQYWEIAPLEPFNSGSWHSCLDEELTDEDMDAMHDAIDEVFPPKKY